VSESRVVECPSIQITTISPEDDPAPTVSRYWDMGDGSGGGWDRERLYLPLLDPFTYRDRCPSSPSPSPASSPSSRGWLSPASSCEFPTGRGGRCERCHNELCALAILKANIPWE
ncbi:unnamed protein product, partial [Tetraodon nigroviridis]